MQRWAFEFLWRNASFQKAIEGIGALAGPRHNSDSPFRRRWRDIAEEFGLDPYIIPADWGGDSPVHVRVAPYRLLSNVQLHKLPGRWFLGKDEGWGAALVFDLRLPIAPQIRVASRMLKGSRIAGVSARAQRDRDADYQGMLRVLDARAAEVSWREIGTTLFPKNNDPDDYAKKLSKAAVRLRDGDYRRLPTLRRGGL